MTVALYDKVTFTIPHLLKLKVEDLKKDFDVSRSEILKRALEDFVAKQEKIKLEKAVTMMMSDYKDDSSLTEMTLLDGEAFV